MTMKSESLSNNEVDNNLKTKERGSFGRNNSSTTLLYEVFFFLCQEANMRYEVQILLQFSS